MEYITAIERTLGDTVGQIERVLRRALYEESHKHSTVAYTPTNSRTYGCAIRSCDNKAYAKGLCNAHYLRQQNGVDMDFPVRSRKRGMGCVECGKVDTKGGWTRCKKHFGRRRSFVLKTAAVAALGAKCVRCDGTFPQAVFDFHHRGEKNFTIGQQILNKSIRALAEELAKCVLLCANCHRLEHFHGL